MSCHLLKRFVSFNSSFWTKNELKKLLYQFFFKRKTRISSASFFCSDEENLFKLMHAAYSLQCFDLFDLTCEVVADKLNELTVEQIRGKEG